MGGLGFGDCRSQRLGQRVAHCWKELPGCYCSFREAIRCVRLYAASASVSFFFFFLFFFQATDAKAPISHSFFGRYLKVLESGQGQYGRRDLEPESERNSKRFCFSKKGYRQALGRIWKTAGTGWICPWPVEPPFSFIRRKIMVKVLAETGQSSS